MIRLIPNWKEALGHYSTKAVSFGLAIQGTWETIPEAVKTNLDPKVSHTVSIVVAFLLGAALIGKFIDQTPPETKP